MLEDGIVAKTSELQVKFSVFFEGLTMALKFLKYLDLLKR